MKKSISDKYVKLSGVEHVLKRPDTYIGSLQKDKKLVFVATNYDDVKSISMEYKEVVYSPGFLKIFDEALVNASDHAIRTNKVTYIKVNIDKNTISIENDGDGIPVVIHEKEKIYIPQLIMGNLLSGSNFDDTEERYVGGRNGIGIKSTNIFSKRFEVETADGKKVYRQVFTNNMSTVSKPSIRSSKKNYTRVTYQPDFERFDMSEIDSDVMGLLVKRVCDISAYNPTIKVFLNGKLIPVKSFKDYMKLFNSNNGSLYYEKINDFLEIGIMQSPVDSFTQVSMVNAISTIIGGTHVNSISNYISNGVREYILKSNKDLVIKPLDVKNKILLFVNCKVINPVFDTQTKENLTSKFSDIKTDSISDNFLKKISKDDMFLDLIEMSKLKEQLALKKSTTTSKKVKIRKLDDANKAGTKESQMCSLYLTEGDCLHENTKIVVFRNEQKLNIEIKNIILGDVVITHNSNIGVVNSINKKIEKSVKIKLKNGEEIICSKNHKWYVYDTLNDDFLFIKTSELSNRYKFVKNRNAFIKSFNVIQDLIKVVDDKYDFLIKLEGEELYSSSSHKFSVFDINENCIKMVECQNINKDIHYLVEYDLL